MTTDLTSFTAPELRSYAEEELGMSFPAKITKAEMIQRINELEGNGDTSPTGSGSANEGNEDKIPTAVVININDDGDSRNYVQVNVNGQRFQIQKGKSARVPYIVYDVLKNAVEGVPVKVKGDDGKERVVMRQRPRHAVSVEKMIYKD